MLKTRLKVCKTRIFAHFWPVESPVLHTTFNTMWKTVP